VKEEQEIEAELQRLVGVLEEMTLAANRSQRDLERQLDLGNGYLSHLFKGRRELKVKHILMLGRILGFDLVSFATRAYRRRRRTDWALQEIEEGFRDLGVAPPASQPPALALDEDQLRQLIRDTVREEVQKLGLGGREVVDGEAARAGGR
jgi:transcriptional regulator with XRE-family HTH domain